MRLAWLAALSAVLGAAAPAHAARLTFTNGTTLELHGGSRAARMAVDAQQAGVSLVTTFTDDGAPIAVAVPLGSGVACRGAGSHHVACASQVVARLRVFGGRGDDQIAVATAPGARLRAVTAHGGGGDDTIDLSGVTVPSYITGGSGNDKLTGGSGDDVLSGGSGADVLRGGEGYDVVDYSRRTKALSVNANGVADDGTVTPLAFTDRALVRRE